jgi:hypothetical protein
MEATPNADDGCWLEVTDATGIVAALLVLLGIRATGRSLETVTATSDSHRGDGV